MFITLSNMNCRYCANERPIKNGHTSTGNQQWYCKKCRKRFIDNTSDKQYPHTKYPFQIIAYFLYLYKNSQVLGVRKIPIKRFRISVNYILWSLGLTESPETQEFEKWYKKNKKTISRQLIEYWLKTYYDKLEEIISYDDAKRYVDKVYNKIYNHLLKNKITYNLPNKFIKCTHMQTLQRVQQALGGKEKSLELIRKDEKFFKIYMDIYGKRCSSEYLRIIRECNERGIDSTGFLKNYFEI